MYNKGFHTYHWADHYHFHWTFQIHCSYFLHRILMMTGCQVTEDRYCYHQRLYLVLRDQNFSTCWLWVLHHRLSFLLCCCCSGCCGGDRCCRVLWWLSQYCCSSAAAMVIVQALLLCIGEIKIIFNKTHNLDFIHPIIYTHCHLF